jgi:hypothetical protein
MTIITSGAIIINARTGGSPLISRGGTASGTPFESGGFEYVAPSEIVSGTTINLGTRWLARDKSASVIEFNSRDILQLDPLTAFDGTISNFDGDEVDPPAAAFTGGTTEFASTQVNYGAGPDGTPNVNTAAAAENVTPLERYSTTANSSATSEAGTSAIASLASTTLIEPSISVNPTLIVPGKTYSLSTIFNYNPGNDPNVSGVILELGIGWPGYTLSGTGAISPGSYAVYGIDYNQSHLVPVGGILPMEGRSAASMMALYSSPRRILLLPMPYLLIFLLFIIQANYMRTLLILIPIWRFMRPTILFFLVFPNPRAQDKFRRASWR